MGRKADYGQIDTEGFERCLGAGKIVGLSTPTWLQNIFSPGVTNEGVPNLEHR